MQQKLYKISHLTKLLGITPRTIRYYDQFGLLPHVKRSDGNVRLFDTEDIEIIKKIRKLQKENFLPLEIIKERLFEKSKTLEPVKTAILTDNTAILSSDSLKKYPIEIFPLQISLNGKYISDKKSPYIKDIWERGETAQEVPMLQAIPEDKLIKTYLSLHVKGYKKVYSIHHSSTLSDTYQHALQASHKVADSIEVVPIDSKSVGGGLGLFVELMGELLSERASDQEISLMATKHIPLIYSVFMLNSLGHLISGGITPLSHPYPNLNPLMDSVYGFTPVLTLNGHSGKLEVFNLFKEKEDALNQSLDLLTREIKLRGRYAKKIMVTYTYLYGDAIDVVNKIKTLFPTTSISLEEGSNAFSTLVGREGISLSII